MSLNEYPKPKVYKDPQTRLWKCQYGIIAGTGTTPDGAIQNLKARLRCPLTLLRARQVQ